MSEGKHSKTIVIGSTSRLGKHFRSKNCERLTYIPCSRRKDVTDPCHVYLDLADPDSFTNIPSDIDSAILLGGITDYVTCEQYPKMSYNINVKGVSRLLKYLHSKSIFTVYSSSNTVLGAMGRSESSLVNPRLQYSKQKSLVEQFIKDELVDSVAIIRLTKMVGANTSPFGDWLKALHAGQAIKAFDDLWMAPISFVDAQSHIAKLIMGRKSGVFHLSGSVDLDYYQFALLLVEHLGISSSNVHRTNSINEGVSLLYQEQITMLNMDATTAQTGIHPIDVVSVILDLVKEYNSINSF